MRILIVLVIRARPISAAQLQWSNACNVRILRAPRVRQARRYDRANPFATPKQDAHSGGEGNTEQLAGIDAILIVDADDASSFLLGKRNGFRFALAQAKVRLQLCDQLPVLHKNNLDSRLIQGFLDRKCIQGLLRGAVVLDAARRSALCAVAPGFRCRTARAILWSRLRPSV